MSQKTITSSTSILNHDVTHELPLTSQFDGRQQVGLLTISADKASINCFLQRVGGDRVGLPHSRDAGNRFAM